MPPDAEYTRKYCICRNFASDGVCTREGCQYSHTLLDIARVAALVGELPPLPNVSDEKVYFLIEYTKYSAILDGADPDEHRWRMRLLAGGRATLCEAGLGTDALGGSVSVQPVYPMKGQGRESGTAINALERRVFGRSCPVRIMPRISIFLPPDVLSTLASPIPRARPSASSTSLERAAWVAHAGTATPYSTHTASMRSSTRPSPNAGTVTTVRSSRSSTSDRRALGAQARPTVPCCGA